MAQAAKQHSGGSACRMSCGRQRRLPGTPHATVGPMFRLSSFQIGGAVPAQYLVTLMGQKSLLGKHCPAAANTCVRVIGKGMDVTTRLPHARRNAVAQPSFRRHVPPSILAEHERGGATSLADIQEPPLDDGDEEPWEAVDGEDAPAEPENIWDRSLEEMLASLEGQ